MKLAHIAVVSATEQLLPNLMLAPSGQGRARGNMFGKPTFPTAGMVESDFGYTALLNSRAGIAGIAYLAFHQAWKTSRWKR